MLILENNSQFQHNNCLWPALLFWPEVKPGISSRKLPYLKKKCRESLQTTTTVFCRCDYRIFFYSVCLRQTAGRLYGNFWHHCCGKIMGRFQACHHCEPTCAKALAAIFSAVSFSFLSTSVCCFILLSFSSLCRLSCSSNLWVSTSSAFLSSSNRLCCARRLASSSSSITSNNACSIVLPTKTSKIGFTSISKSNNCKKEQHFISSYRTSMEEKGFVETPSKVLIAIAIKSLRGVSSTRQN